MNSPSAHRILRRQLIVALAVLSTSIAHGAEVPKLDGKQSSDLAAEAFKAMRDHFAAQPPAADRDTIPRKYWGATMLALKPVKVVVDRANVKIVFQDDRAEAGFYVCTPISSSMPDPKDYREFVRLADSKEVMTATLYRYRKAQE